MPLQHLLSYENDNDLKSTSSKKNKETYSKIGNNKIITAYIWDNENEKIKLKKNR